MWGLESGGSAWRNGPVRPRRGFWGSGLCRVWGFELGFGVRFWGRRIPSAATAGIRGPKRGPERGPERGPKRGPKRGPQRGRQHGLPRLRLLSPTLLLPSPTLRRPSTIDTSLSVSSVCRARAGLLHGLHLSDRNVHHLLRSAHRHPRCAPPLPWDGKRGGEARSPSWTASIRSPRS